MDIREVFIITDGKKFNKANVIGIIKSEGYKHNFMFGIPHLSMEETTSYIDKADEVWTFGDCSKVREYEIAVGINADIWVMG